MLLPYPHLRSGSYQAKKSALCADLSADGKSLVTASFDGTVHLWDISTGTEKQIFTGHTDRVDGVAYMNSSGTILSVGHTTLRVWDPVVGEPVKVVPFSTRPFRIVLSPDESTAIIGFHDGTLMCLSTVDWRETARFAAENASRK